MNTKTDRLAVARALAHQGQYDKALALCHKVEENGKRPLDVSALMALTLALKGDTSAAREKVATLRPPQEFDNTDALIDAGSAWLKLDVPQAGLAYFGEAIKREPNEPLANARLGAALSAIGRFDDALPYLEKARELWPKVGGVRLNLARAYLSLDRPQEALTELEAGAGQADLDQRLYRRTRVETLLALDRRDEAEAEAKALGAGGDVDGTRVAAQVLSGMDRHEQAENLLREALEQHPDDTGLMEDLASLLQVRGRFGQAAQLMRKVLEKQPDNARLWSQFATMAGRRLDETTARDAANKALELTKDKHGFERALALSAHAHVLSDEEKSAEAEPAYREALQENPRCVPAISGLGHLLMQLGRIDEATELYEQLKKQAPLQAWSQLINARQVPDDPKVLERMEQAARRPSLEGGVQSHLLFTLAAAWEKKKDYNRAFKLAQEANEAARKHLSYKPEGHRRRVERIMARYSANFIAARAGWGLETDVPVFVLGMPRSGTTLVEQIIGSHSRAHGAGELGIIPQQIQKLNGWEWKIGSRIQYPDCIIDLTAEESRKFATKLLDELQSHAPEAARVVDKLPHNFENIGLIKLLFPNAKIIHCAREPRDVAMSNYFTDYQAKFGGMGFAYDLTSIGEQLVDHQRLMDHWHQVFPGQILELPYEALVEDTEGWARKMIDYLGLDWEPGVLEFQDLERTVKTASVWQVRQPVYKTSREKWRNYEAHLEPLEKALANRPEEPKPLPLPAIPPGLFLQGMAHMEQKRPDLAEGCFRQLLLARPRHAAAHQFLGTALVAQNKAAEAVREMRLSVKLRPGHKSWYLNLAAALDAAGKTDEADKLRERIANKGAGPQPPIEGEAVVLPDDLEETGAVPA